MRLIYQKIKIEWLKSTFEWFKNNFLDFFIQNISEIFSFDEFKLHNIEIEFENILFPPKIKQFVANTKKLTKNRFKVEINTYKLAKISHVSENMRKYIISVIIGHELIHVIQMQLHIIGPKEEDKFSKKWIHFLREVKAYKYSQILAAKHYTVNNGFLESEALDVFSPIFNYYHELL